LKGVSVGALGRQIQSGTLKCHVVDPDQRAAGDHIPAVVHTKVVPPASRPNAKYLLGVHGPPGTTFLVTFGTQSAE
jgi:hypothetical protein